MKQAHSLLIGVMLLVTAVTGCGPSKERVEITRLRSALDSSNQIIISFIRRDLGSLNGMALDPKTSGKVGSWISKIRHLHQTADACTASIDSLTVGQAKPQNELIDKLTEFHKALQSIGTEVSFDTITMAELNSYGDDALSKKAVLTKMKNDLLVAECGMLQFCLSRICIEAIHYDPSPQIMVSNSNIRRGDTLQVLAWFGTVQSNIDLTITIKGATVPQIGSAPAAFRFAANDPPGTYKLPIKMHYFKPDGSTGIIEKTFQYTILP
jgi:hypothetical protein